MVIRYLLCWFLLAVIAIINGILRENTYGKTVSELAAHQISTITGILFTGLIVWWLTLLWPIESSGQAWIIGGSWLIATVIFEFGFGHFVARHTWSKLLADFNIFNGRLWLLFLVWITVMPYVFYRYGSMA